MDKRSKSLVWKSRMIVVTVVCAALLGWLCHYLWSFDYKVRRLGDGTSFSPLLPVVRVCEGAEFQSRADVCAILSLANAGDSRLSVVDTVALEPLYVVRLMYHAPDGTLAPAPMTAGHLAGSRAAALDRGGFDRDKDSVVELVPGAALTRVVPLSFLFDLRREGKYDLTITYQPKAIEGPSGPLLAELQAYELPLSASTAFEIPLRKAPPPEPAKKAEPPTEKPAPPQAAP